MRCGPTLRLARTHPAHARSNGSGTLSRNQSLEGYTIDMRESEFSEGTARCSPCVCRAAFHRLGRRRRNKAGGRLRTPESNNETLWNVPTATERHSGLIFANLTTLAHLS